MSGSLLQLRYFFCLVASIALAVFYAGLGLYAVEHEGLAGQMVLGAFVFLAWGVSTGCMVVIARD